jgi:hypothetical protein
VITATIVALIAGALSAGPAPAAPLESATVAKVTATSEWRYPSPDPMGVTYVAPLHRLVVVDSEVEETRLFRGKNAFLSRPNGTQRRVFSTLRYTEEPTDVVWLGGKRFVVTSDGPDRTYFVKPGPDGRMFSKDDRVSVFRHRIGRFRDDPPTDVEAIAFGDGALWLADGTSAEVYRVEPGHDGRWAGRGQWDNVLVTHWNTAQFGIEDPEGMVFVPSSGTLLLVGNQRNSDIVEVTTDGELVRIFDGSDMGWRSPSGLALAPAPSGNGTSLFLTDRGVDNDQLPRENDGRLFEVSIGLA